MQSIIDYHQAQSIAAATADARQWHDNAVRILTAVKNTPPDVTRFLSATYSGPEVLAKQLIDECYRVGQVVTISLQPLKPLAMGSHHMVADFREVRK